LYAINDSLRAVAAEDTVPLVDLDADESDARSHGLLESYVHLSRTGCERVSEAFASRLEFVLRQ
jgi:lysophospholipase L1-like esterase